MNEVNSKWSQLVQDGFFSEYTYEAKRRYAKSSSKLTSGLSRDAWIIEIGCGTGRFHRLLHELGYHNLISIDLTIDHLKKAKALNPEGLFVVASGENLPFKSGTFDALVANAAIEHFASPQRGLYEFNRVTDDKARLVITSDCYSWRMLQIIGLYKSRMPIDKTFTYWAFKNSFMKAGFKLDSADAWGLTHYLRPIVRKLSWLNPLLEWSRSDKHWSNATPSNQGSLLLRMFFLDENLFCLTKARSSNVKVSQNDGLRKKGKLDLIRILVSPCCRADLTVTNNDQLNCGKCDKSYAVVDNIPILTVYSALDSPQFNL